MSGDISPRAHRHFRFGDGRADRDAGADAGAAARKFRLSGRHGAPALRHQERRHRHALCGAGGRCADAEARQARGRRLQHGVGRGAARTGTKRWRRRRSSASSSPARRPLWLRPPAGPIAVIATEGTVRGGAYVRAIHARDARHSRRPASVRAVRASGGGRFGPRRDRRTGRAPLSRPAICRSPPSGRTRWCWAARIFPCWRRC